MRLLIVSLWLLAQALPAADSGKPLAPGVSVVLGPVNGVIITRESKHLAVYGDPRENPSDAEKVLFTHHRRDVAWAGRGLIERGAEAVVPATEKGLFTDVDGFWERYQTARFHDYSQHTSRVLATPFRQVTPVHGGDTIRWRNLAIEVLDTPGYTRGAVSYFFEAGGKRIACTGDLIYGDGKILDLFSLQDSIPAVKEDGYHGYAARAGDVVASLRKIAARKPDVLVPARGPVIENPQQAIDRLIARLEAVFTSHFTIDALRWYRGDDKIRAMQSRVLGATPVDWMPMAETMHDKPPDWIVPIANSRLILSASGSAFLVDCGSQRIIQEVKKLQQAGRFSKLDGIYITHYHDDHTDHAQAASDEFHCPVYTCTEMRDILEHPRAYHMPCLTPNPIRPTVMKEATRVRWQEFELTYSYYPGQTLPHGGLLVKKDNAETIFFIGDSFTPTGIDDYCLLNRNFAPPEKGFVYCLNILKGMKPEYLLINQHVLPTFRFSARQIDLMIANLEKRAELERALFPWDDPNFGLDENWACFYPYGSEVPGGKPFELKMVILNHSPATRQFKVTPRVPPGWTARPVSISIRPRQEGSVAIRITPAAADRGLHVITAGIAFGSWELPEWTEAMVVLK